MDDSLIKELSPEKLYLNTDVVIRLFLSLGFLISWKKPDLIPSQDFIFLGEHFLTQQGLVLPPQEKFQNLCSRVHLFLSQKTVTSRQFSQLLGLLNSLADVVPLGRLHIRPLHFLSTPTLASSFSGLGLSSSDYSSGLVSPSSMVDCSRERFERPTSVLPSSKSNFVHGCLQSRLGSLSGRSSSLGSMDSRSSDGAHQFLRNEGSSSCTVSFPVHSTEQVSCSCIGQHHSDCIFTESRRNSLLQTLPFSNRNPSSLRSSSSTFCSSCSRETQCFSRFSF